MTSPEELVALDPHLRELAARLVADSQEADELVQETFLLALRTRPDADRGTRAWLRRILRTKARQHARRERRRRTHEAALPPDLPDPRSELRDDGRRHFLWIVAAELGRLREPYRATLRARFLEGVAAHDLARREGVPVRTVHTRVARGLALLRSAVERRAGRPRWHAAALAALAALRRRTPLRWAVTAGLAAGSLAVVLRALGSPDAVDAARPADPPALAGTPAADAPPLAAAPPSREAAAARRLAEVPARSSSADAAGAAPELDAAPPPALVGRVVDAEGRGVGGLFVRVEAGAIDSGSPARLEFTFAPSGVELARARCDARGAFALPPDPRLRGPELRGRVVAEGSGHVTVLAELVGGGAGESPLEVVVAPRATLRGRVVDAGGAAVADARILLRPPERLLARPGRDPRTWSPAAPRATTAGDGSFALADAFDLAGARLDVRAAGFADRVVELDGAGDVHVVLGRALADALPGHLRLPTGEPVARGRVVVAGRVVETDDRGRFELDRADLAGGAAVWGFVPERLPARRDVAEGLPELDLVVGGPSLALDGRVVDARGEPVAGAYVWAIDPTPLDPALAAWFAETHLNPDPAAPVPHAVLSDAEGCFHLPYLLDRAYRVGALHRETFLAARSAPVAAGEGGLMLTLPPRETLAPVAGRVLDGRGEPVVGARVAVHQTMVQVVDEEGRTLSSSFRGPQVVTGTGGAFRLPRVPGEGCFLDVVAAGCFSASPEVPSGAGREALEVVVARRALLEVRWERAAAPLTHFVVLGADGRPLDLLPMAEVDATQDVIPRARAELRRGQPVLVEAPDTGRTIVLFAGEREVARRAIAWSPGGPTRIEL